MSQLLLVAVTGLVVQKNPVPWCSADDLSVSQMFPGVSPVLDCSSTKVPTTTLILLVGTSGWGCCGGFGFSSRMCSEGSQTCAVVQTVARDSAGIRFWFWTHYKHAGDIFCELSHSVILDAGSGLHQSTHGFISTTVRFKAEGESSYRLE